MTTNNKNVLSDIKGMQASTNNQAVLNSIKQIQVKKTPLSYQYSGTTWNTDLPEKDVHNVFLLMDTQKGRSVVSNGHIIYIREDIRVQDSARNFLYETKLIAWMDKSKAMLLLDCHE